MHADSVALQSDPEDVLPLVDASATPAGAEPSARTYGQLVDQYGSALATNLTQEIEWHWPLVKWLCPCSYSDPVQWIVVQPAEWSHMHAMLQQQNFDCSLM